MIEEKPNTNFISDLIFSCLFQVEVQLLGKHDGKCLRWNYSPPISIALEL